MAASIGIIGGADGPTALFISGKTGANWFNLYGLILVLLLLLPNIFYAVKAGHRETPKPGPVLNLLEQAGRYGCMFLMVFHIGIAEFGAPSLTAFLAYLFGNALLVAAYWVVWILYFRKPAFWKQLFLALLPTCLFLLSGITLRHYLLVAFALVFGIAHITITVRNAAH